MLTTKTNYHHSKLPELGEIGRIKGLSTIDQKRKCVVEAYPLCDNVLPYSKGIHTIHVKFLDNGESSRFSGHWFEEDLTL